MKVSREDEMENQEGKRNVRIRGINGEGTGVRVSEEGEDF